MRPIAQEMSALEEIICYRPQEARAICAMQGHMGKQQDWARGGGNEGKLWARAFPVVSGGGRLGKAG